MIIIYKTIGDGCLDSIEDIKKDLRLQMIPLTLQIGSVQVVDDETFGQERFVGMVKTCPEYPKTAYPSPETLRAAPAKTDAEMVLVITLSSHLSGSYNSATVAKRLYEEEMAEKGTTEQAKKVTVIDSLSAPSGGLNIALFTQNLCDLGLEFDEVVEKILVYRDGTSTCFILESLDTLRKNERLSGLQAFSATALNIKPVIGADTGTIIKLDQARGMNRAFYRTCDTAVRGVMNTTDRIAIICHANNPERAGYVKSELAERVGFREIVVTDAAGVAIVYADDRGIVLAA